MIDDPGSYAPLETLKRHLRDMEALPENALGGADYIVTAKRNRRKFDAELARKKG